MWKTLVNFSKEVIEPRCTLENKVRAGPVRLVATSYTT